MVERWPTQ